MPSRIYLKHVLLLKWRKLLLQLLVVILWISYFWHLIQFLSACLHFCPSGCSPSSLFWDCKDLHSEALLLDASISWRDFKRWDMGYCVSSWTEQIPICNLILAFSIPISCVLINGSDQYVSLVMQRICHIFCQWKFTNTIFSMCWLCVHKQNCPKIMLSLSFW